MQTKQTETKLQADCFQWFWNTHTHLRGLLYHVPNGEKRDAVTANKLKASGLVAGIPDLVFHYRAKTYFFELKNVSGKGVLSEAQKKIHKQLDLQRFIVWVINDLETFKYLIESIINDRSAQFTHGISKADYLYKDKIFKYLYDLELNKPVTIDEITKPETKNKFMCYVSEFIVEGYAAFEDCEILFTNDFKQFYKTTK